MESPASLAAATCVTASTPLCSAQDDA